MKIAIIGAGNVGGTLGRRWAELGHTVVFGVRRTEDGSAAVKGGGALPKNASVASPPEAVKGADVVVLATPWAAVTDALAPLGPLHGVTVIDATNPLGPGLKLITGKNGESGGEQVQAMVPQAHVVKALNTTGFDNMQNPVYEGRASVMLYCGDDAGAKSTVKQLLESLGFEAVDAGPLSRARQLENLAVLWISLAMGGLGRDIAFRLMRR